MRARFWLQFLLLVLRYLAGLANPFLIYLSGSSLPESHEPSPKARSIALAYEWVARITAVALIMVLPGVAGRWLDVRFGTGFLALIGFAIGFCAGFAALLSMVNGNNNKQKSDVTSTRDLE